MLRKYKFDVTPELTFISIKLFTKIHVKSMVVW